MAKSPKDRAIELNGELFFTVAEFARATNKATQTVRGLMGRGNRVRKLKVVRVAGKPLIPFTELIEFPFTVCGRTLSTYHYDEAGKQVEEAKA